MANSKWGNIVFYKTKEGKLRWFDPDVAKTPEGKAKIKAIRMDKQSMANYANISVCAINTSKII